MGVSSGKLEKKYHLQKVKLGQGSFGVVFRGVDKSTNQEVAIKQMNKDQLSKRGVRKDDVKREVSIMRAVSDPNILVLKDIYDTKECIYLVVEYCDGGDFGDKLKERSSSLQQSIAEPEAADWMRSICGAVYSLHQKGICHRDIKPDNFLIGQGGVLKLADFGLATQVKPGELLTDRSGTPSYMSPERHRLPHHSRGYSFSADMWSAGIILFQLLTRNRHPFVANGQLLERPLLAGEVDFSKGFVGDLLLAKYSDDAYDVCKRMLEPDVSRRLSAEALRSHPWLDPMRFCIHGTLLPNGGNSTSPTPFNELGGLVVGGDFSAAVSTWWSSMVGCGQEGSQVAADSPQSAPVEDLTATLVTIETRIDSLNTVAVGLREQIRNDQAGVLENAKLKQKLQEIEQQLENERTQASEVKRGIKSCLPRMPGLPKMPQMPKLPGRGSKPPSPDKAAI